MSGEANGTRPGMRPPANDEDVVLGARLRTARKAAAKSQADLGGEVGVSYQQIQKYESGGDRISASRLRELATACGVSVAWFYGEDEADPRTPAPPPALADDAAELLAAFERIGSARIRRGLIVQAQALAASFGSTRGP